ncbi:hypothetical protein SKAU_G00066180 [Synaphobranchus kaupii]|uniref:Uncharacterized protein n=1 Tax=Synaphobranchus kaupii TaxID=118154 RepID=A0A9Q1JAV5_SYNKA|nr:hypothetical protein SKAU_G00066180 [Synaphobranchus kaupii]
MLTAALINTQTAFLLTTTREQTQDLFLSTTQPKAPLVPSSHTRTPARPSILRARARSQRCLGGQTGSIPITASSRGPAGTEDGAKWHALAGTHSPSSQGTSTLNLGRKHGFPLTDF